ncbi:MAG: ADP-ribosyltransferase [Ureaplasma sp.]|nr:ADP-ribosyltransferase [Ureaplasma sp.]
MNKKILFSSFSFLTIGLCTLPITLVSCAFNPSNFLNTELDGELYIDLSKTSNASFISNSNKLGKLYSQDWYNTLTWHDWNYISKPLKIIRDAYCESEQQALSLYLNAWGEFWNYDLHQGREPKDTLYHFQTGLSLFSGLILNVRGSDYKYISKSLDRAFLPENTVVYHGVEYMENEFYTQLEKYIIQNQDGSYDYSNCVRKTIKSNGFISTSLDKNWVVSFAEGENVTTGEIELPLKEKFIFKIFIPKNITGAAYVSGFKMMGIENVEHQILIDRNSKFEIKKILQRTRYKLLWFIVFGSWKIIWVVWNRKLIN